MCYPSFYVSDSTEILLHESINQIYFQVKMCKNE